MKNVSYGASKSLFIVCSFLVCLWGAFFTVRGAEATESFDPKNVQVLVEHGVELPWKRPGFRIAIDGWMPNGAFSIHAISPSGETIDLVPKERPLRADNNGHATVDIDYERKGLRQGHWMLLVAGKPGIHTFETDLPLVEAPTASRPKWRLTFGKKNRQQKQ